MSHSAPAPPASDSFDVCILTCLHHVQNSHTQHYAASLAKLHLAILVLCPGRVRNRPTHYSHISLPDVNNHFMSYRTPVASILKGLCARARNSLLAARVLLKFRPRVVMCSELDGAAIAIALKLICKHKVIIDMREVYEDRLLAFPNWLQPPLTWLLQQATRFLFHFSDEVIHMSRQRQLFYSYCRKPGLIVSYYPPRNLYEWAERRIQVKPSQKPEESVNVVQAGPLRLTYAADELIEAFDMVCKSHKRVRLFVLGGYIDDVKAYKHGKLMEKLQEAKRLFITRPMPHHRVVSFLKITDVGINLVKPVDKGHYLAQPRKLYEYLAAGVPVVGSNVPTISDGIAKWDCGEVVNPESPEEIAQAILRLVGDPERRAHCARNALLAARHEYCWETQEAVFHGVYRRLLGPERQSLRALEGYAEKAVQTWE
jgi:glycosyltransferase involved in cell wall biosynthesis